jgi:hypothetical protein
MAEYLNQSMLYRGYNWIDKGGSKDVVLAPGGSYSAVWQMSPNRVIVVNWSPYPLYVQHGSVPTEDLYDFVLQGGTSLNIPWNTAICLYSPMGGHVGIYGLREDNNLT